MTSPLYLLEQILAPEPPPFAVLYRRENDADHLEIFTGHVETVDTLSDLLLDPSPPTGGSTYDTLALVPYRQIRERGFVHHHDGSELLALRVHDHARIPMADFLARIPQEAAALVNPRFEPGDADYERQVASIIEDEIGQGEGANFVLRRSLLGELPEFGPRSALTYFGRLLTAEAGTYWTFIAHTGPQTFLGATPERHLEIRDGSASMTPISGTYRYPSADPDVDGLVAFLTDEKETDELYMVVDEELKMMTQVCAGNECRVKGPMLREMARVAHTEYQIHGRTTLDVRVALRETLVAPTVTGSPIENACRVIARHETTGRGYYSGIIALLGHHDGAQTLDSAIMIRTAEIDSDGQMCLGVGATLVRHSDPRAEVAETTAKAAAMVRVLGAPQRVGDHPLVTGALSNRNTPLAPFWMSASRSQARSGPTGPVATPQRPRVLLLDAEDAFAAMLAQHIEALGLTVEVVEAGALDEANAGFDLVVLGPGPGDPLDRADPRIDALHEAARRLLRGSVPFLAVCLSHQVIASEFGFAIRRRGASNQGNRQVIDLFGEPASVGFYNSFAAHSAVDVYEGYSKGPVEVCRGEYGEIHALRGPDFWSLQFHAESILSLDGHSVLNRVFQELLGSLAIAAP